MELDSQNWKSTMENSSGAAFKPTFVTLGPLRIKRRYFGGYVNRKNSIMVYLNFENGGVWTETIKDNQEIEDFKKDVEKLEEQGYL